MKSKRNLPWMTVALTGLTSITLNLAACSGAADMEDIDDEAAIMDDGKYEAWNQANNPAYVDNTFIYEVAQLPLTGQTAKPPIPSDYWATFQDSINFRWDGAELSPAEKVEKALNKPGFVQAVQQNFGIASANVSACNTQNDCNALGDGSECVRPRGATGAGKCVPTWWGICHGWAPYAFSEPPAAKPVVRNGVTFYAGDLEALMSLAYSQNLPVKFLSQRCDANNPTRDARGRVISGECRDMNPGSFHVVVANMVGMRKTSLVEDKTYDSEVWNQPIRGYRVTNANNGKLREISKAEAIALVGLSGGTYAYNTAAARFYDVEMDLNWIREAAPARQNHVARADQQFTLTDHYRYVLEADASGRVIGGEWLGAAKTDHPDFVWWPTAKPTGTLPGGLTYAEIKALNDEAAGDIANGGGNTGGGNTGGGNTGGGNTGGGTTTGPNVIWQYKLLDNAIVSGGVSKYFGIGIPPNTKLTVSMTGSGNADLYMRLGAKPSLEYFGCKSTGSGSTETCSMTAGGAGGTFYVRVRPLSKMSVVTVTAVVTK